MYRVQSTSKYIRRNRIEEKSLNEHGARGWSETSCPYRAIRSIEADKEAATKIMDDFLEKFNAETVCISGIVRLEYDPQSYLNFKQMHVAEYQEPTINKSSFGDFMTTIRSPAVAHKKFMKTPQASGEWGIEEFLDSPSMT